MTSRRTIVLLAILAFAAAGSPLGAQTADRRLDGTVLDSQGLPIVGAQLTLIQPQSNLSRSATSSTERFRFDNLNATTYTLRVTATGFQQQQLQVDLSTDAERSVEIRM